MALRKKVWTEPPSHREPCSQGSRFCFYGQRFQARGAGALGAQARQNRPFYWAITTADVLVNCSAFCGRNGRT
jgi:hypothetical protein